MLEALKYDDDDLSIETFVREALKTYKITEWNIANALRFCDYLGVKRRYDRELYEKIRNELVNIYVPDKSFLNDIDNDEMTIARMQSVLQTTYNPKEPNWNAEIFDLILVRMQHIDCSYPDEISNFEIMSHYDVCDNVDKEVVEINEDGETVVSIVSSVNEVRRAEIERAIREKIRRIRATYYFLVDVFEYYGQEKERLIAVPDYQIEENINVMLISKESYSKVRDFKFTTTIGVGRVVFFTTANHVSAFVAEDTILESLSIICPNCEVYDWNSSKLFIRKFTMSDTVKTIRCIQPYVADIILPKHLVEICDDVTMHYVEKLVIPASIKKIGKHFMNDSCVAYLKFEDESNLIEISDNFLENCPYLQSVKLPKSIIKIANNFMSSSLNIDPNKKFKHLVTKDKHFKINFKTYNLPEGIESIGDNFMNAFSTVVEMILPESLTSIGDDFMSSCTNLKYVKFPKSLTCIGKNICYGNDNEFCDILLYSLDHVFTLIGMGVGSLMSGKYMKTIKLEFPSPLSNDLNVMDVANRNKAATIVFYDNIVVQMEAKTGEIEDKREQINEKTEQIEDKIKEINEKTEQIEDKIEEKENTISIVEAEECEA